MNREQFLIAKIAGRHVAIPTAQVDSVIDLGEVLPAPLSPPEVRGLVAIRSRVVTVIDPDISLGLPPSSLERRRAVITAIDGHHYAILVDTLDEVDMLSPQPLSAGRALGQRWSECATGIVDYAGEPMLVVDLAAWVPMTSAMAA